MVNAVLASTTYSVQCCVLAAVPGPPICYQNKIVFGWVLFNCSQAALYCYPWIPCFLWSRWSWAHDDIVIFTLASQRMALKLHRRSAVLKLVLLMNFRHFSKIKLLHFFRTITSRTLWRHLSHSWQLKYIVFTSFSFLIQGAVPSSSASSCVRYTEPGLQSGEHKR